MTYNLTPHILDVIPPPISEVIRWRDCVPKDADLIDLCQAVPNYPPPLELREYLAEMVMLGDTSRYTPDEGLVDARIAVSARYARVYGSEITPQQICLTIGASQAFWLALLSICSKGDEVIVNNPAYFDHPMAIRSIGASPVFTSYNSDSPGIPDIPEIESLITDKTKALLLVSPSNPTGAVVSSEIIEELFLLARRYGIALIIDETYSDFIQPSPHSLFSRSDWGETLIHIMSFGKSYALTGYRSGLVAGSEKLVANALKLQDSMVVCQPRISQLATKFGAENLDGFVAKKRVELQNRNDRFIELLNDSGTGFKVESAGSFFAWVKHPFYGKTGWEAAKSLALQHGIMSLPGEVFGPGLTEYLRLALGNLDDEMVTAAVERLSVITG